MLVGVGEEDVAPDGVGAAGEAERVLEAWAGEREGEAGFVGFVGFVVDYAGEGDCRELRKVGDDAYCPIVGFGIGVYGLRAYGVEETGEGFYSRIGVGFRGD